MPGQRQSFAEMVREVCGPLAEGSKLERITESLRDGALREAGLSPLPPDVHWVHVRDRSIRIDGWCVFRGERQKWVAFHDAEQLRTAKGRKKTWFRRLEACLGVDRRHPLPDGWPNHDCPTPEAS